MVAFKQGQQVRCIDVGGDYYLRRGEVYEVVCHRGNSVRLSSVPGNWHESRFELVNSAVDPVSPVSAEAQAGKLTTEFTSLQDTEVELPEPFFGMGRYLSIAGTRDAYTKGQLRDYGDKRAANARKAALEVELTEPSAWLAGNEIITFGNMRHGFIDRSDRAIPDSWKPLYLAPPPARPAKPLTTEQWGAIALGVGCDAGRDDPVLVERLVRAIEAHHGIKEQP